MGHQCLVSMRQVGVVVYVYSGLVVVIGGYVIVVIKNILKLI